MNVYYINHSGFMVELEKNVLVFDYYTGSIPAFDRTKNVYVFVSHKHFDHFNKAIFNLFDDCKVHYILSKGCKMNEKYLDRLGLPIDLNDKITYMRKNENVDIGDLQIETTASTDTGVAFMVNVEGKNIYHAGDNGMWLWPEADEAIKIKMEKMYKDIIDGMGERYFDVAFVPADPKLMEDAHRGLKYFLEKIEAKEVYAMHMWDKWDRFEEIINHQELKDFREILIDYRTDDMVE